MIAVDSNILIYAQREDSTHHRQASDALRTLTESQRSWAIPWPCLHEFLAIVTHPRIYTPPTNASTALRAFNVLLDTPGVIAVAEAGDHASILAGLLQSGAVVGPRIHDAKIAAICLGHGVTELWTADRDFSYFPQLRTRNPLIA